MTEPSGHGPFAEAMRELIAELGPAHGAELRLLRGAGQAHGLRTPLANGARGRAQLRLVR